MKLFDVLKTIYTKGRDKPENVDMGMCIVLTKFLSYCPDNKEVLNELIPMMYWIEPQHYFALLYTKIPRKSRMPFYKMSKKDKVEEDKLIKKIQYVMGWSNRELQSNMEILEMYIIDEEDNLKRELAIE